MTASELADRIRRGPAYLLIGQSWLKSNSGHDAFLDQAIRKYLGGSTGDKSYGALFESEASTNRQETVSWLHNRCEMIPVPEAFETVSDFAWNGVITSAVDDILVRGLRKPWRDVQRVTDTSYEPNNPRSRIKLNVWCLFGNVSAPDANGWPPLTQLQFVQRKGTATVMANAVPDLVTALGVLCIEGYDPANDWLNNEALYQVAAKFEPNQAHLFSATGGIREDPFIRVLVRESKLTLHDESLAQFLSESADSGWINLGQTLAETGFGKSIHVAGRSVEVPAQYLRQIQSTGRIITDLAFVPVKSQSRDGRYASFRSFLYQSSYRPEWDAYARGFAFRRHFQTELFQKAKQQVETPSLRGEPLIVHGPTSSGKTVALGQLAFDLQREGNTPVVFIDRNVRQMRREFIDQFCNWAEDQGATAVVVIWDGMQEIKEYKSLNQFLRGRGRRSVLVGSCYQTNAAGMSLPNSIPVSPLMGTGEWERFQNFLATIDPDIPSRIGLVSKAEPESFLGSLYRYLPAARSAISTGLGLEVAHTEDFLLQLQLPIEAQAMFGNNLGDLLAKVGLSGSSESFGGKTIQLGNEQATEIRRLIGFIMLPGQFGLSIPFELLIRGLGRIAGTKLLPVLKRVDIFRISEDSEGNPSVGPRSALEAKLINRRLMGGSKSEIDYADELLSHIRGSRLTGHREIDFAVDLLRFLGPNGQDPPYYSPQFERLAKSLNKLRTEKGLKNPRLMLQESVLFREAAKLRQSTNIVESEALFNSAVDASSQALEILEEKPVTRAIRCQLLVEAAAAYGSIARAKVDPRERLLLVEQAHQKAFTAYTTDPSTFHPLDVVAWTANDLLKSVSLEDVERLKIVESVTYAFALAESEDWDSEARILIERRRMELAEVFGEEVSQKAFETLLSIGSAAGVMLRARQLSGGADAKNLPKEERQRLAAKALDFVNEYSPVVAKDPRALFLGLKLWWQKKTGMDFNEEERFALPFKREEWDECIEMLGKLFSFDEFKTNLTLRLIEAVAFFHRGEYGRGFDAFEELNAEQIFARNRVFRRFLLSDESGSGKARRFSGTVTHVRENKEGLVSVPGFPRGLTFFVRDTGRTDLRQGDDLSDFCIAFNMVGPIADFRV